MDQRPQLMLFLPRQAGKTTALIRAAAVMAERGYLPIFIAATSEMERRLRQEAADFFARNGVEPPKNRSQIRGVYAFIDELQHFSYIRASGDCIIANSNGGKYEDHSLRFNGLDIAGLLATVGVTVSQDVYRDWAQVNDPTFGILRNSAICSVCGEQGEPYRNHCKYCGGKYEIGQLTRLEELLLETVAHAEIIKRKMEAITDAHGWREPMASSTISSSDSSYSSGPTYATTTFTWTNTGTSTAINL